MRAGELKWYIVFLEKTVAPGKFLESKETLAVKFRLRCKMIDYSGSDTVQNSEEFNEQMVTVECYRRPITEKMIAEFNGKKYNVVSAEPISYNQTSMKVRLKRMQE
jgi:head-tail adaptor